MSAFVLETTVSDAGMMAELGYVPLGPCHGPESDGRCVDGAVERASARKRVSLLGRVWLQLKWKPPTGAHVMAQPRGRTTAYDRGIGARATTPA